MLSDLVAQSTGLSADRTSVAAVVYSILQSLTLSVRRLPRLHTKRLRRAPPTVAGPLPLAARAPGAPCGAICVLIASRNRLSLPSPNAEGGRGSGYPLSPGRDRSLHGALSLDAPPSLRPPAARARVLRGASVVLAAVSSGSRRVIMIVSPTQHPQHPQNTTASMVSISVPPPSSGRHLLQTCARA